MHSITTIVLAGDRSPRFDLPKQLAIVGGKPLLGSVAADAATWSDRVIVVLGADAETILDEIDLGEATVILNPEWEEGEASSVRVALDTVMRDGSCEAVLIVPGDIPGIDRHVAAQLVDTFRDSNARVVVPKYRYAWGYPVLLHRDLWERFMGFEGDADVLQHLRSHPEWVTEIWIDRTAPSAIERPTDLPDQPRR
jgi:molybdenum cofactor cytidylyltransferase